MKYTPGTIESGGHIVLTGPIQGVVELDDGTVVDVSPLYVEVGSQEEADQIAHKIGERYAAEGHPDDVEVDPETGEKVQREFVYVAPDELASSEEG